MTVRTMSKAIAGGLTAGAAALTAAAVDGGITLGAPAAGAGGGPT